MDEPSSAGVHEHIFEPVFVPDTFVTGLHQVENLGDGNFRFTFFVKQDNSRICAARLVLSLMAVAHAACWALREIGYGCCGKFVKRSLH